MDVHDSLFSKQSVARTAYSSSTAVVDLNFSRSVQCRSALTELHTLWCWPLRTGTHLDVSIHIHTQDRSEINYGHSIIKSFSFFLLIKSGQDVASPSPSPPDEPQRAASPVSARDGQLRAGAASRELLVL